VVERMYSPAYPNEPHPGTKVVGIVIVQKKLNKCNPSLLRKGVNCLVSQAKAPEPTLDGSNQVCEGALDQDGRGYPFTYVKGEVQFTKSFELRSKIKHPTSTEGLTIATDLSARRPHNMDRSEVGIKHPFKHGRIVTSGDITPSTWRENAVAPTSDRTMVSLSNSVSTTLNGNSKGSGTIPSFQRRPSTNNSLLTLRPRGHHITDHGVSTGNALPSFHLALSSNDTSQVACWPTKHRR
jgi:hypothetical protein